jgi:hypothetical protein
MLPAPLQFITAMIAYAINQRMVRRLDYLQEEVRVLKEALAAATGKTRIDFRAEQRRRLALKGKKLTAEERRACCQIVSPATIPRMVSPAGRAEVRQLESSQGGPPAQTGRRPLARARTGAQQSGLGLHQDPRRSARTED